MHSNAELGINVGWNWAWYRSGLSVIGGLDYQKRDPGSTHTKARRGKMDSRLNGLVDIAGLRFGSCAQRRSNAKGITNSF